MRLLFKRRLMEGVEDSEGLLLERARKFDEAALASIYDRYHLVVYRYLYRQVGDVDTARDLAAEVFHRLLVALHTGKGPRNHLVAWLYRTAHNALVDYYRRQQHRRHLPLEEEIVADGNTPVEAAEHHLQLIQLRGALQRLSPNQQQVIALKFLEDLSNEQVALIMGKSVGAIKSLQHRALSTLQRQMGLCDAKDENT